MTISNEPAFPVPGFNDDPSTPERFVQPCAGMTLRQWYAGQITLGLLSRGSHCLGSDMAKDAIDRADALIKELEKTT